MTTTEYIPSHSANFSDRPLPELLHYLLENLIASVSADELFLYSFDSSLGHAEALAGFPHEPDESLRPVIESHLAGSETTALLNIEGIHPSSGRMWRISHNEETLGTLVILTHLDFLNIAADHSHVQYCLIIAKLLLQQRRSQDNEIIAHTIQEIANGLSNVMSPQSVIDLVCEHLPSADLSFCGLLLYGPQQESLFGRSFSYLELQGSWSQQHGAGVGLGVRVYLDQYADLLAELHSHKIWHIPDMTTFAPRFDALLRATIKGSKIQSIVFITLEVGEQRLGELIIATQDKATFSVHELNMWLAISKLLALSVMAYVLQESKNLVQRSCAALLDSVTDGIVMVLPSTHTQGNGGASVMTVNSYFSNMFHLSEYKAQGVTLSELIHLMQLPEDVRQELTHTWLSVPLRDPSTQRGEFSMVHPDGYSVIIEWHSAPLQQSQKVMGRIFIFHDVTEDRSASSLRTNFISRMSHELRTPLTSIRGFAQVMIDDLHGQLSPLALE
ncbi:hypothetical protein KDA23_01000, partial [Candidatus Saccharibacteria bacterium]|nr:hypothetical protein [Candidatus Saccharibacteria bacterium]